MANLLRVLVGSSRSSSTRDDMCTVALLVFHPAFHQMIIVITTLPFFYSVAAHTRWVLPAYVSLHSTFCVVDEMMKQLCWQR